jgi:hypothetical protein
MTDTPVVVTSLNSVQAAARPGRAHRVIHGHGIQMQTRVLRAVVTR